METTIKIEDYFSQDEIKEILKERITQNIDKDIENTIKVAIKYAFHELIKPEYLEKLPALVEEKLNSLDVHDIIGYASSYYDQKVPARVIITNAVHEHKDKIRDRVLEVMTNMEEYTCKEICIEALKGEQKTN